jgi:hypothetical protein
MIVEANPRGDCPGEFDLELNFNSNTSGDIGTATTRLRKVSSNSCNDVLNSVVTYTLNKGSIGADTISFEFGNPGSYRFTGTYTATKMTGTYSQLQFTQSGRFVASRQ